MTSSQNCADHHRMSADVNNKTVFAAAINNNPSSSTSVVDCVPSSPVMRASFGAVADQSAAVVISRRSDLVDYRGGSGSGTGSSAAAGVSSSFRSPKLEARGVSGGGASAKKAQKTSHHSSAAASTAGRWRSKATDGSTSSAAGGRSQASDSEASEDESVESEQQSFDTQSDSRSGGGGGGVVCDGRAQRHSIQISTTTVTTAANTVTSAAQGVSIRQQGRRSRRRPVSEEWEILEGLRSGQQFDVEPPSKFSGYIMKSRKWPMKGWHKRFFFLENGILTYSKSAADLERGKFHGTVDTGLSVIACKKKGRRIDVDADDLIYHLKAKSAQQFEELTNQLKQHRLYRQHELTYGTKDAPKLVDVSTPVDDCSPIATPLTPDSPGPLDRPGGSFKGRSLDRSQKVATWLIDSQGAQAWNKELTAIQAKIFELGTTLEQLSTTSRTAVGGSCLSVTESLNVPDTPSVSPSKGGKVGKKYGLSKHTSKAKERKAKDRLTVGNGLPSIHLSTSNPNLLTMDLTDSAGLGTPVLPSPSPSASVVDSGTAADKLHEQFYTQAKNVHETLKTACRMITTERERLKRAIEQDCLVPTHSNAAYVLSLKQALAEAVKQNAEYRSRLSRIHADSAVVDIKGISSPFHIPGSGTIIASGPPSERDHPRLAASESLGSQSEFYDAEERLNSTSEDTEEEEVDDEDISDTENTTVPASEEDGQDHFSRFHMRRRSKLPMPKVESDVSVWSLLCKNIGKDLSKVSMPVSMNEPLNALQRLCEELEYSELLDRVVEINDPFERMVLVAAFCVSGYSSTYTRAGQKPFNPVLGETYECIREDKGWKFVAEQACHHPPISACHCESKNFMFWQDMQVKTKFWGKSMEVQPIGIVSLQLIKPRELYTWNKATSCVHNLLGGQRWIDHYGEVIITNHTLDIVCKLTFVKSGYWSAKKHEVYGVVQNPEGRTVHRLYGKWNEGLYYGDPQTAKCVWRPGSLPPDSDMYYGFTRFAIELNEIDSEQVHLYPRTDTRFRPDQRLLEQGKLDEADAEKQRVEQLQREQRKKREEDNIEYSPVWFTLEEVDNRETYVYNGKYWETRHDPGFVNVNLPKLW